MNELIALDPDYGTRGVELPYILRRFGLTEGRFIARLPKNWKRSVEVCAESLPTLQQERVKVALQRAVERGALLPYSDGRSIADEWIERAIAALLDKRVAAVISDKHPAATMLDDAEDLLTPARGERVLGTIDNYLRLARPLLLQSDEIAVIDPYFSFDTAGRRQVLAAIVEQMRATAESVLVITRAERLMMGREPQESVAERMLRPLLKNGQRVEVFGVDDAGSNRMHARYLLSVKGAIRFDKGFELLPDTNVDVEIVSPDIHHDLVRVYIGKEHGFSVRKRFVIHAKR